MLSLQSLIGQQGQYNSPHDLFEAKRITVPGNISSPVSTGIFIEPDEFVYFEVLGTINVGFLGLGEVDGTGGIIENMGGYNKYNGDHGALVGLIKNRNIYYCSRSMFQPIVDGIIDEIAYRAMVDKNKLISSSGLNYLPGNYFISTVSGELLLDINDTETLNNSGEFIVNIYTITFNQHKKRNIFNYCPKKEPDNCSNNHCYDCNNDDWLEESILSWWYHGFNDSFRGKNKYNGCQCVYDNDELILNHKNQGSFDIAFWLKSGNLNSPDAVHLHLILDVLPHDKLIDKFGIEQAKYLNSPYVNCNNKTTTLFLIDYSGSMRQNNKMMQAKEAAIHTLATIREKGQQLGKQPEVGIMTFNGDCRTMPGNMRAGFLSDLDQVESMIKSLNSPRGGTPLPQAIAQATAKLETQLLANGESCGKLIVLGDGQSSCEQLRPSGTYAGIRESREICDSSPAGTPQVTYFTVGFGLVPGSEAERDLQYLAASSGGKYFNAKNGYQLTRAFQKINQVFIPIDQPQSKNLPTEAERQFLQANAKIEIKNYEGALDQYESFVAAHPNDSAGTYNMALMYEANDRFLSAIKGYEKYLQQAPGLIKTAKVKVEEKIALLQKDYLQFVEYMKKALESDLTYLDEHYQKLRTSSRSVSLAGEFSGYIREKKNYYEKLPQVLELENAPWMERYCNDISSAFEQCIFFLDSNPSAWDLNGISLLSNIYYPLSRLVKKVREEI